MSRPKRGRHGARVSRPSSVWEKPKINATPASAHHICGGQVRGSVPPEATAENTAIAYEPVWAIGTGKTPSDADIVAMHAHIRHCAIDHLGVLGGGMRILYGGSVKPSNAAHYPVAGQRKWRIGGRREPEGAGFSGDYRRKSKTLTRNFDPSLIRRAAFCPQ